MRINRRIVRDLVDWCWELVSLVIGGILATLATLLMWALWQLLRGH